MEVHKRFILAEASKKIMKTLIEYNILLIDRRRMDEYDKLHSSMVMSLRKAFPVRLLVFMAYLL